MTIPALIETMRNDCNCNVRCEAAESLGEICDPAAIPSLIEVIQNDSSFLVRQCAARVLKEINATK